MVQDLPRRLLQRRVGCGHPYSQQGEGQFHYSKLRCRRTVLVAGRNHW